MDIQGIASFSYANQSMALQQSGQEEETSKVLSIKGPETADTDSVEISEEAQVNYLEKRIQELSGELKEVQESDMPEKEKQQRIQAITNEMAMLTSELAKLRGLGPGAHAPGGTRAEGFGSSLT